MAECNYLNYLDVRCCFGFSEVMKVETEAVEPRIGRTGSGLYSSSENDCPILQNLMLFCVSKAIVMHDAITTVLNIRLFRRVSITCLSKSVHG